MGILEASILVLFAAVLWVQHQETQIVRACAAGNDARIRLLRTHVSRQLRLHRQRLVGIEDGATTAIPIQRARQSVLRAVEERRHERFGGTPRVVLRPLPQPEG